MRNEARKVQVAKDCFSENRYFFGFSSYISPPPLKTKVRDIRTVHTAVLLRFCVPVVAKIVDDNATRPQRVTGTANHATRHCGNLTRYWKVVVARAHFSRKNCSQLGLTKRDKYFKKDVKCLKY